MPKGTTQSLREVPKRLFVHRAHENVIRLFTLRRKEALKKANITHIVSALRLPLDVDGFKHHVVEVDDVEDENIMEHFAESNAFIEGGLEGGGGVLVHW